MSCPKCGKKMTKEIGVVDYPDDSYYGHGQTEIPYFLCECGHEEREEEIEQDDEI